MFEGREAEEDGFGLMIIFSISDSFSCSDLKRNESGSIFIVIMGSPPVKLSDLPSYLRPRYNFPEHRECYATVSQLQVHKPWGMVSTSFNEKTSYARSFSPVPSSGVAKATAKQIVKYSNIFAAKSPSKAKNKHKHLSMITETVTGNSSIYGKKIAPKAINSPIGFKAEDFESVVEVKDYPKITKKNSEWIGKREKKRYADRFNGGEYIPSISHMQVYGRKEPVSKFEKYELWKPNYL
jgi:hypothetical protein